MNIVCICKRHDQIACNLTKRLTDRTFVSKLEDPRGEHKIFTVTLRDKDLEKFLGIRIDMIIKDSYLFRGATEEEADNYHYLMSHLTKWDPIVIQF